MRNPLRRFAGALICGAVLLQCGVWLGRAAVPLSTNITASMAASSDSAHWVHSIELPHFEPDLPIAPGRNEYLAVCVTCHSPRYVTMQPLFPQRQWEATVDKMVKNYGAQMDDEQRKAIVGYLVTIHGPNTTIAPSDARDEDSDSVSPAPLPPPPEPTMALKLAATATERETEVSHGADLFSRNCASCHGTSGRGDGYISPALWRKPKDLATTRFSLSLLNQVLWNGKRGTSMPSWRSLPQPDRAALAAYVQSLHLPAPSAPASSEALQQGSKTFLQNCAPCHGEAGDGKGPAAATLLPEPANFKLKQPNPDYVQQVLRDGIPGTAMPSWQEQISEADRKALAVFVRSLFEAAD